LLNKYILIFLIISYFPKKYKLKPNRVKNIKYPIDLNLLKFSNYTIVMTQAGHADQ